MANAMAAFGGFGGFGPFGPMGGPMGPMGAMGGYGGAMMVVLVPHLPDLHLPCASEHILPALLPLEVEPASRQIVGSPPFFLVTSRGSSHQRGASSG